MKRALLLLLTACADPPSAELDTSTRATPIINGTFDPGDPAVVALTDTSGDVICTATLVSPRVAVAAAHCLLFSLPDYLYVGSDPAAGGGTFVPLVDGAQHPDFDFDTLVADISVVVAGQPVPVPVIPVSRRPPVVGEPARFVGFGYTQVGPSGEYGRKYETTASITSVEPTSFGYGVATCNGDSGGPAFVVEAGSEVLAGVTSWGDGPCASFGYDTRVDVYADWIQGYIDAYGAAGCAEDGMCASPCPDPDPDCPCADDGFCLGECSEPGLDPDCCRAEGTCAPTCPERDPDCPIRVVGEPCTTDFECGENLCAGAVCSEPCDPAAPACAGGALCLDIDGRDVCVEPACPHSGDCETTDCECRAGGRGGGPGGAGGALLLALVIALFRPKRAD